MRNQIKRFGATYRPDNKYWMEKIVSSEREEIEKFIAGLGAEIIRSKPI